MAATGGSVGHRRRRGTTKEQRAQLKRRRWLEGIELKQLQEVPAPEPLDDDPMPAMGPCFKRAKEVAEDEEFPPILKRVFCVVAAYADAGVNDPSLRMIASRAKTTKPNTMFMLRRLEMRGLLRVVWAKVKDDTNVYTVVFRDD